MNIAIVASRIRKEEKLLFAEMESRGLPCTFVDESSLVLDINSATYPFDVVLERCIVHEKALCILKHFYDAHVLTINSYEVAQICGDKLLSSQVLIQSGVPMPRTMIAFTPEKALEATELLGYPVVLKPVQGSWGLMLSKINDRNAAEAIFEHRETLGSPLDRVYYLQEYIDKPGRDIRCFVVGNECVGAYYRYNNDHWITSTARGGTIAPCEVTPELAELSLRSAQAVGGGIVTVDFLETQRGELLVNEINYTIEFRAIMSTNRLDMPAKIVDYVIECLS